MKNYTIAQYQAFTDQSLALTVMRYNNKKFGHRIFLLKRKVDTVQLYVLSEVVLHNLIKN